MEITFQKSRVDAGPGGALVGAMRKEVADVYAGLELDGANMPKAGPVELGPPGGALIVGWCDNEPICCGGFKKLSDGGCEIKRMFVLPTMRGRGVARVLLRELERRARQHGYTVARLDTGPLQPHARSLYESEGYKPVANFNANPVATFFGEKSLS
ncbi:MAG: GNAT family N-acetyltransferase [Solirubrobacteraceae bacterium]